MVLKQGKKWETRKVAVAKRRQDGLHKLSDSLDGLRYEIFTASPWLRKDDGVTLFRNAMKSSFGMDATRKCMKKLRFDKVKKLLLQERNYSSEDLNNMKRFVNSPHKAAQILDRKMKTFPTRPPRATYSMATSS